MTGQSESPQSRVQQLFGAKSAAYNKSSLLTDKENMALVLKMAGISGADRVLDVATGTGFMAIAMADTGAEVIATDFTMAMLAKTRESLSGRDNTALALADADCLPFAAGSFNAVSCRVSIHHFAHPKQATSEMARVCRTQGRVVIMDVVSSEDEAKSELHNRMGRLRDSSEVRQWRCSELEDMLAESGLQISQVELWPHLMAFDEWIRLGTADDATAAQLREMMIDSMDGDKAGLSPRFVGGDLFFEWTTAIIVARK